MLRFVLFGAGCCAFLAAADPATAPPTAPAPAPPPAAGSAPAPAGPHADAGQVRGTILYGRRDPAVGAIVIVRSETGPTTVRIATAGTSGTFGFDGLPDGTYRAEVRRDGYVPIVKSGIQVRAPFRAVVELLLVKDDAPPAPQAAAPAGGDASLAGTIRSAGGAPIARSEEPRVGQAVINTL